MSNKEIKNLLIATRVTRTFPSISLIFFASAFAQKITTEIYLLSIILVLLYIPGGILNAIKDKDYSLPRYSKTIVILLPIIALIISSYSLKLFLAAIAWIIFGFIYNVLSRKIILLDSSTLCVTHYFIPTFFTLMILGINLTTAFLIAFQMYMTVWFICPVKNLKGIKEDQSLGYKTLATSFENGEKITKVLFHLSIIPILISLFFYNLNFISLVFLSMLTIIYLFAHKIIKIKDKNIALRMARLNVAFFALSLTFSYTENIPILILSSAISLFFFAGLIKGIKTSFYK